MTDPFDVAAKAWAAEKARRSVEPNDRIPEAERHRIYTEGRTALNAVLAAHGVRAHGGARKPATTHCPTHPTEPGGTTPAGDAYCGECRRQRHTTTEGETR